MSKSYFFNLFFLLLSNLLFAQDSLDSLMYSYGNKFWNTDKIIFVEGRNCEKFGNELENLYDSWKTNPHYKVKYEDELDSADLSGHLNFFGAIKSYRYLDRFLPPAVSLSNDGFKLGTYEFNDSLDAISLITSDGNRRFELGNSMTGTESLWTTFQDISQYMIMQNYAVTHHGFLVNNEFDPSKHFDVDSLRKKYLKEYETKYYSFYYAPEIMNKNQNIDSLLRSEDEKYLNILKVFNLEAPQRKIKCYAYKDLKQKYYFSATPGSGNPFIKAYQNHSIGLGPVEHESIHILFDNLVGGYSTFFSEGTVGYYYSTVDSIEWKKNRSIVSSATDFQIKGYLNNNRFGFSQLDYSASAYFVKFLIDTYGLEKFKSFFKYNTMEEGFKKNYGATIDQISEEWNKYFEKTKIMLGPNREIVFKILTRNVSDTDKIFITGDNVQLGEWNPEKVALTKQNDNQWLKSFNFPEGTIFYYKITRGSWDKEALDTNGNIPQNSVYEVTGDSTITIKIGTWKDQ